MEKENVMSALKNVLFIGDPISQLKLKSDSSLALAQAALNQGKNVYWCEPKHLSFFQNKLMVQNFTQLLHVNVDDLQWENKEDDPVLLDYFQVCFVRKDPPFDEQYKDLCWLLSSQSQVKVINSAEALLSFHEKSLHWRAYSEGYLKKEEIIPTCMTNEFSLLQSFCSLFSQEQKFICKPWLGHGGEDIFLYENKNILMEKLKNQKLGNYLIQPFLPEIHTEGDRRVIVANGKVICDYVRLPAQGKIASNGAQGGSAVLREMSEKQIDICQRIAQFLKEKNILFAGLDLIGNYVGEINITSPTGIRTYESLSNKRVADEIFTLLVDG